MMQIKEALGMNVSEEKAKLEGYSSDSMKQKSAFILNSLSPYMGDSVSALRDEKDGEKKNEESLVTLIESA